MRTAGKWIGVAVVLAVAVGPAAACGGDSVGTSSTDDGGDDGTLDGQGGGEDAAVDAPGSPTEASGGEAAADAPGTLADAPSEGSEPSGDAGPDVRDAVASADATDAAPPMCVEGSLGPSGSAAWASGYGDAGTIVNVHVAVDGQGNVFAYGGFEGTINFAGTGDGGTGSLTSAGQQDVFLAKFDASGHHLWSQRFGDASTQYAEGVAADVSGNVYVTGSFYSAIAFDGSADAGSYSHSYAAATGFVAKFDGDGRYQWSREVGSGGGYQFLYGIAVDGQGGVGVSGSLQGQVSFTRPDGGVDTLSGGGANDVIVFKLTVDGDYVWGRAFGDASDQGSVALAVDGAGDFYAAGYTNGSFPLGGAGTVGVTTGVGHLLIKLGPDGTPLWGRTMTGAADVSGEQTVAVTPSGDVYLGMTADGDVTLVGDEAGASTVVHAGSTDAVVAAFDTNGDYRWTRGFGDSSAQSVGGLAVDPQGAVIVAGTFQGTLLPVGVDGGTGPTANGGDAFVMKLDEAGAERWSVAFTGPGSQAGLAVALSGCSPVVAGTFSGDASIPALGDAGALVLPASAAPGAAGMYLASLAP